MRKNEYKQHFSQSLYQKIFLIFLPFYCSQVEVKFMPIDKNRFQPIKEGIRITQIFRYLVHSDLKNFGQAEVTNCPFCAKRNHFYLFDNNAFGRAGFFSCLTCKTKGDVVTLVAKLKRITLQEAIYWLLYEWLGFTPERIDILKTEQPFTKENMLKFLDYEHFTKGVMVKSSINEVGEEEFEKQFVELVEETIQKYSHFIDKFRALVNLREEMKVTKGALGIMINGWDVEQYRNGLYYYWRAKKIINNRTHTVHLGIFFDTDLFPKKLKEFEQNLRENNKLNFT
jgi:hypothetical protein